MFEVLNYDVNLGNEKKEINMRDIVRRKMLEFENYKENVKRIKYGL